MGSEMNFNGTSDFIHLNDSSALQPANSLSISLIIKPNLIDGIYRIFRKRLYGYALTFAS